MAETQYYGPPDSGQAVQSGSVGAAYAAETQSQDDANQTSQTSGSGANINNNASARTALGGGGSGSGGGGGGSGGGGYSIGASLANAQTISSGFSGSVRSGNTGALSFGDFNPNFRGTQTVGISGKVLAIGGAVVALLALVLLRRKG